jgi:hypothetical protein
MNLPAKPPLPYVRRTKKYNGNYYRLRLTNDSLERLAQKAKQAGPHIAIEITSGGGTEVLRTADPRAFTSVAIPPGIESVDIKVYSQEEGMIDVNISLGAVLEHNDTVYANLTVKGEDVALAAHMYEELNAELSALQVKPFWLAKLSDPLNSFPLIGFPLALAFGAAVYRMFRITGSEENTALMLAGMTFLTMFPASFLLVRRFWPMVLPRVEFISPGSSDSKPFRRLLFWLAGALFSALAVQGGVTVWKMIRDAAPP